MALRSTLSILGLWQYNNDIFSGLIVPKEMNKDIAITEILSQCAELELVYPSYDVMSGLIANWSKIELPIWERVYKDCTIKYNPIWNKDGTIKETETRDLYFDEEGNKTTTNQAKPITNVMSSDPVTNTTTTDPITNITTTDPITNVTTTDPVTNTATTDPVTNITTTDPVTNTTTTDPITNVTTTDPITNSDTTQPVTTTTTTDPITNTDVTQPITNSSTNMTTGYNSGTWENSEKTVNELGEVRATHSLGSIKTSEVAGKIETSHSLGETETTEVLGETETTQTLGNTRTSESLGRTQSSQVLGETEKTEVLGEVETTQVLGETETTQTLGNTRTTHNLGGKDEIVVESPDYHNRDHGTVIKERIEQGNIGVTKTQEMLRDDLELLPELNPYQFIVNSFKKKFCLLIY